MSAKQKVDYGRIERGWREGVLSPRQLAEAYTKETGQSVSHAAIIKHFKSRGVERDLSEKIRTKTESIVTQAMVTGEVTPVTTMQDKEIIESASIHIANVDIRQRKDVARYQDLMNKLFEELDTISGQDNADALEQLSVMIENEGLASEDALIQFKRISTLGSRVKVAKDLGDTIAKLIPLERTIYKMDKEVEERKDPLGDLLKSLTNTSSNNFSVVDDDPEY